MKEFNVKDTTITLLTLKQARKLPKWLRSSCLSWWLRTPSDNSNFACYVYPYGDVSSYGDYVYYYNYGVRPAFKIKNLDAELYERIKVGAIYCTVIDKNLVLADNVVCEHRFDDKSNVWETSDLKNFIESDDFKELLENEELFN